jgi:hypothetical protein
MVNVHIKIYVLRYRAVHHSLLKGKVVPVLNSALRHEGVLGVEV